MFAFSSTTLLGKAGKKAVGHPGPKGQGQQLPRASDCPQRQQGPNYHSSLCVETPDKTCCLWGRLGGCSWGPQLGPGSTHPAGATSRLPPPGPESCDLADTPKLSEPCLELCPFALPGVVGMHTGGARKGSAGFQGEHFSGGLGDIRTYLQADRGSRQVWEGQGAVASTLLPHL